MASRNRSAWPTCRAYSSCRSTRIRRRFGRLAGVGGRTSTAGRARRRRAPRHGGPRRGDGARATARRAPRVSRRPPMRHSQSGSASQSTASHGGPGGCPCSFRAAVQSSTRARCLSRPPRVIVDGGCGRLEPGRVQAAALPGELRPGALQREQQHLDLAGRHRRLVDRGVQDRCRRSWPHARVGSGRSASGSGRCSVKPDASPTARALLALELVQGSPGITADRLADKLGVSERAARRYVGILREAGIPIESVRGPYGGYRVGRGLRLPPLVFSADRGARPGDGGARRPPRRRRSHRPGRQRARQDRAGAAGAGGRAGRGGPADHGARPRPRRRPARPRHDDRRWCRPARTAGGCGSATAPRPGRSGSPRSTRGRSWSATAGGTCCAGRTAADARRAYRIDRVRARRGARRHVQPARRPRPGRDARGAPRRRLGVRRRGASSTRPSRRWRAACPAPLGRLEPVDAEHHPAGRQHQQPVVVRRAARGASRRRTGSCGGPSCRRPRASSGSGWWRRVGVRSPESPPGQRCRRSGRGYARTTMEENKARRVVDALRDRGTERQPGTGRRLPVRGQHHAAPTVARRPGTPTAPPRSRRR